MVYASVFGHRYFKKGYQLTMKINTPSMTAELGAMMRAVAVPVTVVRVRLCRTGLQLFFAVSG